MNFIVISRGNGTITCRAASWMLVLVLLGAACVSLQAQAQRRLSSEDEVFQFAQTATRTDWRDGATTTATAYLWIPGATPNSGWLRGIVGLDENGFFLTGAKVGSRAPHGTSTPGIYAVGDVRSGSVKRVASAAGEGAVVIADVHDCLAQFDSSDPFPLDADSTPLHSGSSWL